MFTYASCKAKPDSSFPSLEKREVVPGSRHEDAPRAAYYRVTLSACQTTDQDGKAGREFR